MSQNVLRFHLFCVIPFESTGLIIFNERINNKTREFHAVFENNTTFRFIPQPQHMIDSEDKTFFGLQYKIGEKNIFVDQLNIILIKNENGIFWSEYMFKKKSLEARQAKRL